MEKKQIVEYFLQKGLLVTPEILDSPITIEMILNGSINSFSDLNNLKNLIQEKKQEELGINLVAQEMENENLTYEDTTLDTKTNEPSVKIIYNYDEESHKRTCNDFISYFRERFKSLQNILRQRQELENVIAIGRLKNKKEKEAVSLIGMVKEVGFTKNNHLVIKLEDLTGTISCFLMNSSDKNLFDEAKELAMDEIIGISGFYNGEIVYINSVIWPDVPLNKELKKSPDEVYAAFIGDIECGSNMFLKEKFESFLSWIKGDYGSDEQKRIAKKLRYLFIAGDLVEGVGIYPGQENDLVVKDIYEQYEMLANYLKQIPTYVNIVMCGGNHDAMRIAEPQPPLYKSFAKSIWELPNAIILSNPSIVNIHSSDGFPGFDVLLYHGFSFVYYADKVQSIRTAGGQERVDLIMKYLLKRRHLAPTHTSTLYLPIADYDPLFIKLIPDFFVTGHIHQTCAAMYRNVTLLNCSCWLDQTPFQEKMGIVPKPARVLVSNLQTREIKIMNF